MEKQIISNVVSGAGTRDVAEAAVVHGMEGTTATATVVVAVEVEEENPPPPALEERSGELVS